MLGTRIGNYQVTSKLGEGGMGVVYLARHAMLDRQAAVKVLRPAMSDKREAVTRFFNEARAATAIKHPGIIEVFDFGFASDGSAYIIMEFLEGQTLSARIRRGHGQPAALWLPLVRQIAGALHAAHEQRIVHRDLKPDNIFVIRDPEIAGGERIKLLDFGIAKLAPTSEDVSVTRTGTMLGTPTYMAPEQCRGAGGVDHRADLYALGCIMYLLACGRPPFVTEALGELIARHIYFEPEPPRTLAPGIDETLEQLILWLLRKDPAARPQSATEVIAAIDEISGGTRRTIVPPMLAHAPELPPALHATTLGGSVVTLGQTPRRRYRWRGVGAVAIAAAVGVGLAIVLDGETPAPAASVMPLDAAPPHAAAVIVDAGVDAAVDAAVDASVQPAIDAAPAVDAAAPTSPVLRAPARRPRPKPPARSVGNQGVQPFD